ncbi:hypothetical protein LCGC14_0891610 [marine sediment metagenome]|uniref:Uncharacterized protein n=1 Tax=marine sediment metagenome TaxID=412755 RepID=A0A0F9NZ14_9ZZZZ
MFCRNCGSELTNPNQSFCSECGSEIEVPLETSQSRTERSRQLSTNTSQSPLESTSVPIFQQNKVEKEGQPGPYSKKCLVFAIVSSIIVSIGWVIASGSLIRSIIPEIGFGFASIGFASIGFPSIGIPLFIAVIILHTIGLLFGIESRLDSKKAGELEPTNVVVKIGTLSAIYGIISNVISMALAFIIAPILLNSIS